MTVEVAVVAVVAVLIGGLIKSISGIGFPLVTVPLISYVSDVETAVVITSIPNLAVNATLAIQERGHRNETRDLPVLAITGFVGAVFGTLVLVSVPDEPLVALLVVVVVIYAVLFFTNPEFELDEAAARRGAPVVGLAAGSLQGAIGISGPLLVSWLHSYRLPRNAHIFAITTLFAAAGIAQAPTLALGGQLQGRWAVALAACVPALATVPVGRRLRQLISSTSFDRLVVSVLVASTIGLAVRTFL